MYVGNACYLLEELLDVNQSLQAPRLPFLVSSELFSSLQLVSAMGKSHFCNEKWHFGAVSQDF